MNAENWVADDGGLDQREKTRFTLSMKSFVAMDDGRNVILQLRDISASGFGGHAIDELQPGTRVTLILPDEQPIQAEIVWQIGPTLGGRFVEDLPSSKLNSLIDGCPEA
jgi:hypothetical protein